MIHVTKIIAFWEFLRTYCLIHVYAFSFLLTIVCFWSDKGHVVSVNCENEDQIHPSYINESTRYIKPPVDNKDYQLEFVPVEEDGQMKGNF